MTEFAALVAGILAGTLGAFMALPQAIRSVRFGTKGVSSTAFQIMAGADVCWLVYSIGRGLTASAISLGISTSLGLLIVACFMRDERRYFTNMKYFILVIVVSAALAVIYFPAILIWGLVLSLSIRVAQLQRVRHSENITDVSTTTWLISLADESLWAAYGLLKHDPLFASGSIVAVTSTVVLLVAIKRKQGRALERLHNSGSSLLPDELPHISMHG